VLLGQIVFALFFGFLGILLAVPLTAILQVLVEEIYIKDILGERANSPVPENPGPDSAQAIAAEEKLLTERS
jgi:predicted PurR-regulated permease PerM